VQPAEQARSEVERVIEALKRRIRAEGFRLRQIEERLGQTRDYLRQVLSGKIELKYEHIAGILAAMKVEPMDFFAEVYGPSHLRRGEEPPLYHYSYQLVFWSSLRAIIRELEEKGVFSKDEAARLLARLETPPEPPP